jgi:hypothetical protein
VRWPFANPTHERDDRQQINRPKQGPTGGHDHKRIDRPQVGPTRRDRMEATLRVLEGHPVFAPGLLPRQKCEPLTAQRMKRVGDFNP